MKFKKLLLPILAVLPLVSCQLFPSRESSTTTPNIPSSSSPSSSTPISSTTNSIITPTPVEITQEGALASIDNGVYPIGNQSEPFSKGVCTSLDIYFMEMNSQYGDGILVKCTTANKEDDFTMMIDAGQKGDGTKSMKPAIASIAENEIDFAIMTHGHADHVGGFSNAVSGNTSTVTIKNILDFGYVYTTSSGIGGFMSNYGTLRDSYVKTKNTNYITAIDAVNNVFGTKTYYLAQDLTYEVLDTGLYRTNPNTLVENEDCNNTSIAGILRYKDFSMFLSGDLDEESSLISKNSNLSEVTLMKAGHHGSNTSNSMELLNILKPKGVIISAAAVNSGGIMDGRNNDHPNAEAIVNFKKTPSIGDNIYFNMTMGTIDVNVNTTTLDYTITGAGATRLKYQDTSIDQSLEKNMKLEQTYFYNNVVITKLSKTLKQYVDEALA